MSERTKRSLIRLGKVLLHQAIAFLIVWVGGHDFADIVGPQNAALFSVVLGSIFSAVDKYLNWDDNPTPPAVDPANDPTL